jgi:hypothetical protein
MPGRDLHGSLKTALIQQVDRIKDNELALVRPQREEPLSIQAN